MKNTLIPYPPQGSAFKQPLQSSDAHRSLIFPKRELRGALVAMLALLPAISAHAVTCTWSSAGDGNWDDTSKWTGSVVPNTSGTATFNVTGVNGPENIYLNGDQSISTILINNTGATTFLGGASGSVASNKLTLATSGSMVMGAGAGAVTFGSASAAVNLSLASVAGSTYTFTNSSTANLLTFNNGITTAASSGASTLTTSGAGAQTFNGVISDGASGGKLGLTINATGTTSLNGVNTYSGPTSLGGAGSTIVVGNNAAFGNGGLVTVGAASIALQASGGAQTIANPILFGNAITCSGPNGITLSGSLTTQYGDRGVINNISSGVLTLSGNIGISDNAGARTFTIGGTGNTVISGTLANGSFAGSMFSITSTGTTTLNAANTYTGATSLSAAGSTILVGSNAAFGNGGLVTVGAASITLQASGGAQTIANPILFGNAITCSGPNGITLSGSLTTQYGDRGVINNISSGVLTLSGNIGISDNAGARTFTIGGTGNTVISGTLANGSFAGSMFSITSTGTTTLNAANTYTGATSLSAAGSTILVGSNAAFGNGGTVTLGAAITLQASGGARTVGNNFILRSNPTFSGSNAISLSGSITNSVYNSNVLNSNISGAALAIAGNLYLSETNANRSFALNGTGNTVISGTIADTSSGSVQSDLNINNTGITTLSGANTFTGKLALNSGNGNGAMVRLANADAVKSASQILIQGGTYGTLWLGADSAINNLKFLGASTLTQNRIVLDRATAGAALNQAMTFALGVVQDWTFLKGSRVASGTPTVTASGATIFSANYATTSVGINPIGVNMSLGAVTPVTPTGSFSSALTLDGNSTGNQITGIISNGVGSSFTNTVTLYKAGPGTWALSGANTYTGSTYVQGGTLNVDLTTIGTDALYNGIAVGSRPAMYILGGNLQITGAAGNNNLQALNNVSSTSGYAGSVTVNNAKLNIASLTLNNNSMLDFSITSGTLNNSAAAASSFVSSRATYGGYSDFAYYDANKNIVGAGSNYTGAMASDSAAGSNFNYYTLTGNVTKSGNFGFLGIKITGDGTLSMGGFKLQSANNAFSSILYAGGGATNQYTITSGTLNSSNTAATEIDLITASGATLNLASSLAIQDATGKASVMASGAGTLSVAGGKNYTGVTGVLGGTYAIDTLANGGSASGLGASTNAATNLLIAGGTVKYIGSEAAPSTNRSFTIGSAGATLDASGVNPLTWAPAAALAYQGNQHNYLTLTGANTGANTFGGGVGVLADSGFNTTLIKSGNGTWILAGANTYTGDTYLNGGILGVTGAETAGTSGPMGKYGAIVFASGTLQYSASNTADYSNRILRSTGAIAIDTNSQTVTFAKTLDESNVGGLIKSGAGTLVLSASNSYTGPTYIINSGALNANVASALPTANGRTDISMDQTGSGNSTLTLGASQSIASLTGAASSTVNLGGQTLTVGSTSISGTTTFAGSISGAGGSLVKDGNSTQVLSGNNNSYTGATNVNAGKLIVSGSLTGSTSVTAAVGTTLQLNNGGYITTGGTVAVNGTLALNGSSTVGKINLNAGSTLSPTISGTAAGQYGQVSSTGGITLANTGSGVTLSITTGYTPHYDIAAGLSASDKFVLALGNGTSISGAFKNVASVFDTKYNTTFNEYVDASGNAWAVFYNVNGITSTAAGSGSDIALYAIPEPTTWAMFVGGLGMLGMVQRMRRFRRC